MDDLVADGSSHHKTVAVGGALAPPRDEEKNVEEQAVKEMIQQMLEAADVGEDENLVDVLRKKGEN